MGKESASSKQNGCGAAASRLVFFLQAEDGIRYGRVTGVQTCALPIFAPSGSLAPDMYHGKTASEPDGATKLFMALNIAQAEKDLRGAAQYLAGQSSTKKLGAVGFCMGGQLALYAATLNPTIGACVNFYGIHPHVKPDYSKLSGPVLGLFAEKDGFVTPQVAKETDAAIKKGGKQSEIHVYPGVDHAFFNDEREAYNKAAAADAWKRTLAFFRAHLK